MMCIILLLLIVFFDMKLQTVICPDVDVLNWKLLQSELVNVSLASGYLKNIIDYNKMHLDTVNLLLVRLTIFLSGVLSN